MVFFSCDNKVLITKDSTRILGAITGKIVPTSRHITIRIVHCRRDSTIVPVQVRRTVNCASHNGCL